MRKKIENNANIVVYLGGIHGVGKSSLLKAIQEEMEINIFEPSFDMMNYTNLDVRDYLDKLNPYERSKARRIVFNQFISKNTLSGMIIDGHYSLANDFGHEWAIPNEFLRYLGPFILISANPKSILDRRQKDLNRKRNLIDLDQIKLDQSIEKLYAKYISHQFTKPFYEIKNEDFDLALKELKELLHQIFEVNSK